MEYSQAKHLLKHALENQKSIKVDKLNELLQVMNINLDIPTDENELLFLRMKVRSMESHIRNIERDKSAEIKKLKEYIRIQETLEGVEILKRKNGIPSVILVQGNRYIRDMQSSLNNHKSKRK